MRVFVGGIFHETNRFSPIATAFADYTVAGAPGVDGASLFGYSDLVEAAEAAGWSVERGFFASAQPSGPTDAESWAILQAGLAESLRSAEPVDAVLLFCHGAQVAEGEDDCEGAILALVRDIVGDSVPVGMEIDLHANVTGAMLDKATQLVACWEYPHIDFGARAVRLVELIGEAHAGRRAPHLAHRHLPLFANLPTRTDPGKALVAQMARIEARPQIAAVSVAHGFALSDTPEACSTIWVSGEADAAELAADELARAYQEASLLRFAEVPLTGIAECFDLVMQAMGPGGPVVLVDRSDNAGGGAAGDSTFLLHALIEHGVADAGLGLMWDPAAVAAAEALGIGNRGVLSIGGNHGLLSGPPLVCEVEVLSVVPSATQRIFGNGAAQSLGPSAAIRVGGITVIVNSIRQQIMSREPFEAHGIDPAKLALVVVKSANHFEEAFRPIARRIIYCDAPGSSSEDLSTFAFERLARPSWPLDPIPAFLSPLRPEK